MGSKLLIEMHRSPMSYENHVLAYGNEYNIQNPCNCVILLISNSIYKYLRRLSIPMNKTIKEVAKMMDNKINRHSYSIQSERLTIEQVQIVEEFVNAFNKRISRFIVS